MGRVVSCDNDYFINRLASTKGIHSTDFRDAFVDFTKATCDDRWPEDYHDKLARGLPKDGAILVDHLGIPWMCAVEIRGVPATEYEWPGHGIRHEIALEVTSFLSQVVTFVRSYSGSTHVLFKKNKKFLA